jgi:hypothetical protein
MWHIPINASERSLLYADETFEQFENLLNFFNSLENEDNFDWWETFANDIEKVYGFEVKSDSRDDGWDAGDDYTREKSNRTVIVMESNTTAERYINTVTLCVLRISSLIFLSLRWRFLLFYSFCHRLASFARRGGELDPIIY